MKAASSQAYSESLALFSRLLREKGLAAGIGETEDAVRVVALVGMRDKERLRSALCAVYAKSRPEQKAFNEVFDGFFIGAEARKKRVFQEQMAQAAQENQARQAREDLSFHGKDLPLDDSFVEMFVNLPEDRQKSLLRFLDLSRGNARNSAYDSQLMRQMIERQIMTYSSMDEGGTGVSGETSEDDLMHKNLSEITDEEIPHVIALMQVLVKRLNGAISRQYQRSGKTGRLDFRRTIHQGLGTGGAFYRLSFKKRRRSKKRVILLCDVSGSMVKFSQFAIRFVKSMSDVASRSRAFLFSEGFKEVSPFALRDTELFQGFVRQSGLWAKGTDLAQALDQLMSLQPSALSPSTVLLILSDTRTVSVQAAEEKLRQVQPLVSEILWMNPIPKERWGSMKSVEAFQCCARMLDCSTLDNLAKACKRLSGL